MTIIKLILLSILSIGIGYVAKIYWYEGSKLKVNYEISIGPNKGNQIKVNTEISNIQDTVIVLTPSISDDIFKPTNFQARTASGSLLKLKKIKNRYANSETKYQSSYLITSKYELDTISIEYTISVGTEMLPDKNMDDSDFVFGYLDNDIVLISGMNLFLIPEGPIKQARVVINKAMNKPLITTWEGDNAIYNFDRSELVKKELVNGIIAIGDFNQVQKTYNGKQVAVWIHSSFNDQETTNLSEVFYQSYEFLSLNFHTSKVHSYTAIFVPDTQTNHLIYTPPSDKAQSISMSHMVASRWRNVVENLCLHWLNDLYLKSSLNEKWFTEATIALLAVNFLDSIKVMNKDEYSLDRYIDYFNSPQALLKKNDGIGQQPFLKTNQTNPPSYHDRITRYSKAFTIVNWIDTKIKSIGGIGIGELIQFQRKTKKPGKLIEQIGIITGIDKTELDSYINGDSLIPFDREKIGITINRKKGFHSKLEHHDQNEVKKKKTNNKKIDLTIVISAFQDGLIENCGCKIKEETGGIARFSTSLHELRQSYPDLVLVALGRLFPIKAQRQRDLISINETELYLELCELIGYDVAGISKGVFLLGPSEFQKHIGNLNFPFINANVYYNEHPLLDKQYITKIVNNRRIGFISVSDPPLTGHKFRLDKGLQDLSFKDPLESINSILQERKKDKWDIIVVFGRLNESTINNIVTGQPEIDVIITEKDVLPGSLDAQGRFVKWASPDTSGFVNNTLVLVPMSTGAVINTVHLAFDTKNQIKDYELDATYLAHNVKKDPKIQSKIDEFYLNLNELSKTVPPLFQWASYMNNIEENKYVGVDACKSCHQKQYNQWLMTGHATAMQTLEKIGRQYNPKCTVCHVVGQGYISGYQSMVDRSLRNVQCEMCHGMGGQHIKNPARMNILKTPSERHCVECHNPEHSNFNFITYYPRVKH